jgi:hypothetical protein
MPHCAAPGTPAVCGVQGRQTFAWCQARTKLGCICASLTYLYMLPHCTLHPPAQSKHQVSATRVPAIARLPSCNATHDLHQCFCSCRQLAAHRHNRTSQRITLTRGACLSRHHHNMMCTPHTLIQYLRTCTAMSSVASIWLTCSGPVPGSRATRADSRPTTLDIYSQPPGMPYLKLEFWSSQARRSWSSMTTTTASGREQKRSGNTQAVGSVSWCRTTAGSLIMCILQAGTQQQTADVAANPGRACG